MAVVPAHIMPRTQTIPRILFIAAVTVFVVSAYGSAYADESDTADDTRRIEALMEMLSGNFDAGRHRHEERLSGIAEDDLSIWASRSFAPMTAPDIGPYVMLSASYNRYDGEWVFDPYEFLVWTVETIPGILDGIKPGGLVNGVGGAACPIRWSKADDGYLGISKDCLVMSVSQLKVLNWNWSYDLKDDRLEIELAGRDKDDGTFLFGTREGRPSVPYRLHDISEYEAARAMVENPFSDADLTAAADLLHAVLEMSPNHDGARQMLDDLQTQLEDVNGD